MSRAALAVLALLALAAAGGVTSSGADFAASASSPANAFTAAADFNTVAVALSDPGTPLRGTVALQATASSDRGIQEVRFESSPAGAGSWTAACQATSAPYACDWDSSAVADGSRDLRAIATDLAGYERTSAVVGSRVIDNTAPTVAVVAPAGPLRGTVTIDVTAGDGSGSGVTQVTPEIRPAGGAWSPVCVDALAPYACTGVDTTLLADGLYDVRALAEDGAGFTTTSSAIVVRIDNAPPPVPTLDDPGTTLQGSVALSGTATDAGSGIGAWVVQSRPAGGAGAWADACSDTSAPYGCTWDTTGVADALYDVRAVARDQAGNETPSATLTNRRVDNNGPTVTLTDPGTYLRGTVSLSASASDPAGMQSVIFERALTSGGGWTAICTDTATPFTCSFDTTGVADGTYDLRARALDTLSHANSATVSAREVDNTVPAASAVDAGNGGATAGLLEPGDWLRLTWSEPIAPASVLPGWDGSALGVRVELVNVNGRDEMDFWDSAGTTRLNLVDSRSDLKLNANFVTTSGWFDATLTRAGGAFTVTFGAMLSGTLVTASTANINWKPSILPTDLAGNASSAFAVGEPNPQDLDF